MLGSPETSTKSPIIYALCHICKTYCHFCMNPPESPANEEGCLPMMFAFCRCFMSSNNTHVPYIPNEIPRHHL